LDAALEIPRPDVLPTKQDALGEARKIRILHVDDDTLFLKLLSDSLARQADFEVLPGSSTGEEALTAIEQHLPDIVLLDLKLNGSGIEAIGLLCQIVQRFPVTRIVVLSGLPDDTWILEAMGSGARGYLSKSVPPSEVYEAIRAVAHGQFHVENALVPKLISLTHRVQSAPHLLNKSTNMQYLTEPSPGASPSAVPKDLAELLTNRELEVLKLMTQGLTNQQIADVLIVSHSTVKTHISSILTKTGVGDRRLVALWLARHGFTV
jgi:DNA-binding NarL/FixJ family response regulator